MISTISKKALDIIKKMQQGELTESVIYEKISKFAKGEKNKETLRRLASEEKAHYEIWKKYTNMEMKPNKYKVFKSVKSLDETKLNQVGRAGWQLCGVTQDEYGYVYYLKKKES